MILAVLFFKAGLTGKVYAQTLEGLFVHSRKQHGGMCLAPMQLGLDVELVVPYRLGDEDFRHETEDASIASRLYLDPMIGFNTTREEDVELLRSIPELAKKGRVLVGASRKRIVKKLVEEKSAVGKSVGGNVAIAVWAAMQGASVVRVHDVKETVQALRVVEKLRG